MKNNWQLTTSWILFVVSLLMWGWLWSVVGAIFGYLYDQGNNNDKAKVPMILNIIVSIIVFLGL